MSRTFSIARLGGWSGLVIALMVTALALAGATPVLGVSRPAQAGALAPAATAWTPPSPSYRISVTTDGLYALDYTYLSGAGLPVDSIDPRTFRMFYMGEEIAIRVVGEDDGCVRVGRRSALLRSGRGFPLPTTGSCPPTSTRAPTSSGSPTAAPTGAGWQSGIGSGAERRRTPSRTASGWEGTTGTSRAYPFEYNADHLLR